MHPLYNAMFTHLQEFDNQINALLDSLPPEALDWRPGAEMNSVAVLVTHICGAQRYWVGSTSRDGMLPRNRPAEFQTQGVTHASLKADLAYTLRYTQDVLNTLTVDDLTRHATVLRESQPVTVGWALVHAVQHIALHLGQLQLMAQLWQQRG